MNVNGISLLNQSNQDAMETLRKAMQAHGTSSPVMSITVARDLHRDRQANAGTSGETSSVSSVGGAEQPIITNHIIRVSSSSNIASISTPSDISPPKPPRLYQNAMTSVTIPGGTGSSEPVLIEGDDSFAEVKNT